MKARETPPRLSPRECRRRWLLLSTTTRCGYSPPRAALGEAIMLQVPMLKAIALRLGSALFVLLVIYLPATGRDLSSDGARCVNRGKAFSLDEQIDGCTAILQLDRRTVANRAGIYANRGRAYYAKKDYDRAIADYDEALKINPNLVPTYIDRGVAHHDKKDLDRAI